MITQSDDGWVRTHEDAAQLLKYEAIGATVVFDPLRRSKNHHTLSASREFTLVMDAAPHHAVNGRDIYSLPCKESGLRKRVRELLTIAKTALEPARVGA